MQHMPGEGMAVRLIGFLPLPVLAYLVVLAVATAQIAVAEEYRPRPAATGQNRFLSMVVADRGYYGLTAGMAKAGLTIQAVNTALTGADIARRQPCPQSLRPLFQLPRLIERNIAGLQRIHFNLKSTYKSAGMPIRYRILQALLSAF